MSPIGQLAQATGAAAAQGGGVSLVSWLPFTASLVVAVIAAAVAVYQSRRSASAQLQLEQEKLRGAERAAELAEERADRAAERDRQSAYRREQVLPFLDALDKTLNSSYQAAYIPEHFPDLGGRIPQIRQHADQVLAEWMSCYREMSQQRMRLFLAIDQDELEGLVSQLVELQDRMQGVLSTRHRLWYRAASQHDLWESHRAYMTVGYKLLMDIRALAMRPMTPDSATSRDEDARRELSSRLAAPLEKLSTATLPYGSRADFTWLALWDIDARPEWLSFVEGMHQGTQADFEAALGDLTGLLYRDGNCLEAQLIRLGGSDQDRRVFCLTAKLASPADLDAFVAEGLPTARKRFPILWSSLRQPIEFRLVTGADGKNR